MGYLRIATHPAILPSPLTFAGASANISALLSRPHIRTPGESNGFWELYLTTADGQIRGNDIPDAHLAALMRQHGVETVYTRNRGFHRYQGIVVRDPVA